MQKIKGMQKTTLSLVIAAGLLLTVSACQPKSETSNKSDTTLTNVQAKEQPSTQTSIETPVPKVANDTVAYNKLDNAIETVNDKSKIEEVLSIQQQLTSCLPTADNTTVLKWLESYQVMYERFLATDNDIEDEGFFTVMNMLEQSKEAPVEPLKVMSPRVQYLISLVKSDADVSVLSLGEGFYVFHHDLKATADIFIPYLPKNQVEFI